MRQRIVPNLWFDGRVEDAIGFYTTTFPGSIVLRTSHFAEASQDLHLSTPGDIQSVEFQVEGLRFIILNGGSLYTMTPSVSFIVYRTEVDQVDQLAATLGEGGKVLMPVGSYPFSARYAWVQDKFGVSWQIMLADSAHDATPALLFSGEHAGQAEEALSYYAETFPGSVINDLVRYPAGADPEREGTLQLGQITVDEHRLSAMDSAQPHDFAPSLGISLVVECSSQEEIDHYWKRLSAVPEVEQCGWCQDKFGVYWQVAPIELGDMLSVGTPEQVEAVTTAFIQMKKFNLAALRRAYSDQ